MPDAKSTTESIGPGEKYWYTAHLVRVVDGDTIDVILDLGCDVLRRERIRLYGVNAPESKGATAPAGKAAKDFLVAQLGQEPFLIHTIRDKSEKFGRLLGDVFLPIKALGVFDPVSVNKRLIDAGHAVAYFGGAR